MKRNLLYQLCPDIGHELKSSLANMQANVSLIKGKLSHSEKGKILPHLEKIQQDITEMNTTIIDLVDVIQIAKKQNALVYSLLSLPEIIAELSTSWKMKNAIIQYEKDSSPEILGDRILLTRALDYLIKHLVQKSLEKNPIIIITQKISKNAVTIRIEGNPKKQKVLSDKNIVEELVITEIVAKHGGKLRKNASFYTLSLPLPEVS